MSILIDPEKIALIMVEHGIRPSDIRQGEHEGFTNALVDALTEAYDLEGKVAEAIAVLTVCPECNSIDWDWQDSAKICNNCHLEF